MCVMCYQTKEPSPIKLTNEEAVSLIDLIESRPEYSFDEDLVNAYRKIAIVTGRKDRSVH